MGIFPFLFFFSRIKFLRINYLLPLKMVRTAFIAWCPKIGMPTRLSYFWNLLSARHPTINRLSYSWTMRMWWINSNRINIFVCVCGRRVGNWGSDSIVCMVLLQISEIYAVSELWIVLLKSTKCDSSAMFTFALIVAFDLCSRHDGASVFVNALPCTDVYVRVRL